MTMISYRETGRTPYGAKAGTTVFTRISGLVATLHAYWQEQRTSREIESMPLDLRKDLGWPSADIDEHSKAMR
jgi:hypothetical protein